MALVASLCGCGSPSDGTDGSVDLGAIPDLSMMAVATPDLSRDLSPVGGPEDARAADALDSALLPDLPDLHAAPDLSVLPDLTPAPPLALTLIVPARGPTTGGTMITIFASAMSPRFINPITVTIGGVPCANATTPLGRTVTCTTSANPGHFGKLDVVVTNGDGAMATSASGFDYFPGTVQFGAAVTFSTGATGSANIVATDFNKDGKLDVATSNLFDSSFSVLLGMGDGTLQTATSYPTGMGTRALVARDLNKDGFVDVATADFKADQISLYLNKGDAAATMTRTTTIALTAVSHPSAIAIEDLDGDGQVDLINTNQASASIAITLGSGIVNGTPSFAAPKYTSLTTGTFPDAVALDNFDGDTRWDVCVGFAQGTSLAFLSGVGNGTFAAERANPVGAIVGGMASGEFNGAAPRDLASVNLSTTLSVQPGSFTGPGAATAYAAGPSAIAVKVADINLDGNDDLVVSNSGAMSIGVYLGKGDGSFNSPLAINTIAGPFSTDVGDFNGDGLPDLAVTTNLSGQVAIQLNTSN